MEMVSEFVKLDLGMEESWERPERDPALSKYVDELVACIDSQIADFFLKLSGD